MIMINMNKKSKLNNRLSLRNKMINFKKYFKKEEMKMLKIY